MSDEGFEFESLRPPLFSLPRPVASTPPSSPSLTSSSYRARPTMVHPLQAIQQAPTNGVQSRHERTASDTSSVQNASSAYPTPASLPSSSSLLPSLPQKSYFYYQLFTESYGLRSRFAFDPENESLGRIPKNRVSPPHTAAIVKRHIAHYERWPHLLHLIAIWSHSSARNPMVDDEHIAANDGAPGSSPEVPLVISIRDSEDLNQAEPILSEDYMVLPTTSADRRDTRESRSPQSSSNFVFPTPPSPAGLFEADDQSSPFLLPSPILPPITEDSQSRSPAVSVTSPERASLEFLEDVPETPPIDPIPRHAASPTLLARRQQPSSLTRGGIPAWVIDETGFGEPTMHPTEVGRVVSQRRPPGWESGEIRFQWFGPFMDKMGGKKLLSGTTLRNGMRVWGDIRGDRKLRLKEDTFSTFRVILVDTREIIDLWIGDLVWDQGRQERDHPPNQYLPSERTNWWRKLVDHYKGRPLRTE